MRGVKRDIDWARYDTLMAQYHSRRQVAEAMGLSESTLRSAAKSRGAVIPATASQGETSVPARITTELSMAERSALETYERTIEAGLKTFLAVGNALLAIRDGKLYRADYATFEEYCQRRWGVSRPYAYQLIDASVVVENVSAIADIVPTNEAQARPLTRLDPEEQRQAWREAVETAPASGITAAHVAQTVKARAQRTAPTDPAREVSAIADNTSGPATQPPTPKEGRSVRPSRLAVQARAVALLQHLPDAAAWPLLEELVDAFVSWAEVNLETSVWNSIFGEIQAVRALFPEPPKTKAPRSSRAQLWTDALDTLRHLQEEYQNWLDNMPENFQMSRTAELLQTIVDLDLDELDVEHPQGFGRD